MPQDARQHHQVVSRAEWLPPVAPCCRATGSSRRGHRDGVMTNPPHSPPCAMNAAGEMFRTCSSPARDDEALPGTMMILDHAPKGRTETITLDPVHHHDG